MAEFARICVFCGSRTGDDPRHVEAARTLGLAYHQLRYYLRKYPWP